MSRALNPLSYKRHLLQVINSWEYLKHTDIYHHSVYIKQGNSNLFYPFPRFVDTRVLYLDSKKEFVDTWVRDSVFLNLESIYTSSDINIPILKERFPDTYVENIPDDLMEKVLENYGFTTVIKEYDFE